MLLRQIIWGGRKLFGQTKDGNIKEINPIPIDITIYRVPKEMTWEIARNAVEEDAEKEI